MKIIKVFYVILVLVLIISSCTNNEMTEGTSKGYSDYIIEKETENNYTSEPENSGITHEEAQEQGGFFILKSDGSFVPLCKEISSQRYSKEDNIFMISGDNSVPILESSDMIVLFSSSSINDEYYFVPVLKEGYTVPFDFYKSDDDIWFINLTFRDYNGKLVSDYDDYQIVDVLSHFGEGINGEVRVHFNNANNSDARTFYENETIDLENFCTDSSIGCSSDKIFFTENFNEKVTVDFYSGTQYCEETFYADIKCYIVDGCEKKDYNQSITGKRYYSGTAIIPEYTKEGYVILDTSSLENGKYVIAHYNNREIVEINR